MIKKIILILYTHAVFKRKLTVFKDFRVLFFLKRKTIQLSLSENLNFQQKKAPNLPICYLLTKSSVSVFDVTNR